MSDVEWECVTCHTKMVQNVLARWPDGSIKECEWVCECGKARGWYVDGGEIDLDEVRASAQLRADNDFRVLA